MEDLQIIDLYFARDERAIIETRDKYERYLYSIAWRVLSNHEDSEEVVDDTYVGAWNAIPPHRPNTLSTFLGKITRNLALKKYRSRSAEKRGGGEVLLLLDELEESLAAQGRVDEDLEASELTAAINRFLATLNEEERKIFLHRYWFFEPVKEIAESFGFTKSKVKMTLKRTRDRLAEYLKREELLQ